MNRAFGLMVAASALSMPEVANAQEQGADPPPANQTIDENGVDLARGSFTTSSTDISIGDPRSQGISYTRYWTGAKWTDTLASSISGSISNPLVTFAGASESFTLTNGVYLPDSRDGSLLSKQASGDYLYTSKDGTTAVFGPASQFGYNARIKSNIGLIKSVVYPDGNKLNFNYQVKDLYVNQDFRTRHSRLQSVVSNASLMVKFNYALNNATAASQSTSWGKIVGIVAVNCDREGSYPNPCSIPDKDTYNFSKIWPQVKYDYLSSGNSEPSSVTDPSGRVTNYTYGGVFGTSLAGIRRSGAAGNDVTVSYAVNNLVDSVTRGGGVWSYSKSGQHGNWYTTVTDPTMHIRTVVTSQSTQLLVSNTDGDGKVTSYQRDGYGRLTEVMLPEGNRTQYGYDSRGNVKTTVAVTKLGMAKTVATVGYEEVCSNPKTCNQPIWATDLSGKQTDYTYDPASGLVTSVTLPAVNGVRPQQRYSYTVANGVTLLSGTSVCRSQGNCVGTSDETKTTIDFGGNLWPTAQTVAAGDGSKSTTSTMTYDDIGNVVTVDGPLPGTADVSRASYDASRRVTATMAPDPDGAGSLKPLAQRFTYASDGQIELTETGTVPNGAVAWSEFVSNQAVQIGYDIYGHKTGITLLADGVAQAVTHRSYDAASRLLCTALRMDPAQWPTQTDACTPQTGGPRGPDRVTRFFYDPAGRTNSVISGYGTGAVATETKVYTANGQVGSVTDANGNVTSYAYDAFDRPWRTCYQTATSAACAGSPGDYEQANYAADGTVESRQLRDGQIIGYGYDGLGRLISKNVANTVYWETDKGYSYDLTGQLTGAWDSNGRSLGFTYDALGRKVSQSDNWYAMGNASFDYDAAGRRTRMTWNDGLYMTYEYRVTGEMTAIRERGDQALAVFDYDDVGRRMRLGRSNGTETRYAYDAASRLSSLTHDLAGTAQDQTLGFTYNPAGQIASRSSANEIYAFTGRYAVDRSYGVNGLNQLTSAGPIALGYDRRGSLTSSGDRSYVYTSENRMATAPESSLAYDPLDRMFNINAEAGVNTTLVYDGADVIAEIDQSNGALLKRYVYGPGSDEPILWYEGPAVDNRRWLHADERGSVVAVTDATGAAIAINRYDEFGIPQSGNLGRFQYTGQKWLPSVGMYDYKARMYSPTLGRFMQTDPIGYGDGINWYNYVGGDPVNSTDPSGMERSCPAGSTADICATVPSTPNRSPSRGGSGTSFNAIPLIKDISCWIGIFCKKSGSKPASARQPDSAPQNGQEGFSPTLGGRFNLDTICPAWHRKRNRLNTNLPKTMSDANRLGWQRMSAGKSLFHLLGWGGWDNTKFISKDGHREAVYDGDGRLITSGPNIGTYNYYNPETHPQEHTDIDVMPYLRCGN